MAVVIHHNGNPTEMTAIQKEKITRVRVRMFSGVSGGGSFFSRSESATINGTCSTAVVDNTLAIEASSGPELEAIVLGRDCRRQIAGDAEAGSRRLAG
jgi:hypothetical protein